MYFKLSYVIQNLNLYENEELITLIDKKIDINLYKPSEEDISKGTNRHHVFCDAVIDYAPSPKNLDLCNRIINKMDLGFKTEETRGCTIDDSENNTTYFVPHISAFPEYYKEFYTTIHSTLNSAVKVVLDNIMWLHNYNGRHNPPLVGV